MIEADIISTRGVVSLNADGATTFIEIGINAPKVVFTGVIKFRTKIKDIYKFRTTLPRYRI